jgi:hypothetical protein
VWIQTGTTAKLIAAGLRDSGAPDAPQDLTTAKTVAKVSVVSGTVLAQWPGAEVDAGRIPQRTGRLHM